MTPVSITQLQALSENCSQTQLPLAAGLPGQVEGKLPLERFSQKTGSRKKVLPSGAESAPCDWIFHAKLELEFYPQPRQRDVSQKAFPQQPNSVRREGAFQGNSKLETGSGTGKGVSKGKWTEGGGPFVPPTAHQPAEHHFPFQSPA